MSSPLQTPPEPHSLPRGTGTFRAAGTAALARLSSGAHVSADPPESFRLDVVRSDLGEVTVDRFRATPFRLEAPAARPEDPPVISVCFVGRGVIHFDRPTAAAVPVRGCWIAAGDSELAFSAREPVEVLRAAAPLTRFPREVLDALALPQLTGARTAVSDGLFGLLRGVLDRSHEGPLDDQSAAHLARAVVELVVATIDPLAKVDELRSNDAVDRLRALEYIEQHLGDPATSPDSIATALRIGRRRLYRLFEEEDTSVAGRIRQRRLDGVAGVLLASSTVPSVRGLAKRFGFSSTDALTRNFRERFGTSIRGYHERLHAAE